MKQELENILKMTHYNMYNEIVSAMEKSWQIEGTQSILDHGRSVCKETEKIIKMLENKDSRLPQFLIDDSEFILANLVSPAVRHIYTVFHDCGKPFCDADP